MNDGKTHLLLAASGSVALVKLRSIITSLDRPRARPLSIRIVLTESAARFFNGGAEEQPSLATVASLPNVEGVHLNKDEWTDGWTRGGSILHINLRKWADVMFIVPLSANTLAKLALGMSDNLLTSVVRAWDTTGLVDGKGTKRIVVAPAMNTAMWLHPITAKQVKILEEDWGVKDEVEMATSAEHGGWFQVLRPIEKALACGDVGGGGMMEWKDIVKVIEERLELLP
ncbi:putative thymidylate synthase [Escovopsis weberi]|uniref:Putative thymidylate synthase n=1 Tax=Escovopsis weberi TaxID=150374 RepID=A0A0M8MYN5_ESCWE|nr:putative thymidylate synthase [Escovopsis weberi]